MTDLSLPNKWFARPYQQELFRYMMKDGTMDGKRAACVWHRRAGKDSCCLNLGSVATQVRVGTYWHMLPTLKQARRVIWDGIDKNGRRMIDQAFPKEMRVSTNNSEMKIELKNGSIWQCVGSDNYDSLVGTNPIGVIFSEYSIADPNAWDYLRPVLAENGGWAMFIYTPRGKNHGHEMREMAKNNPKWFYSELTVEDTLDDQGNRFVTEEAVQEERDAGMSEEKIAQEFYCSFDTGMEGAFYTRELNAAEAEGRIGEFPWDPSKPVQTWWDIGLRDNTAIIFTQRGNDGKPVVIDYLSQRNRSLEEWIRDIRSLPYVYDEHKGPHDLEHRDYTTGKTRTEFAANLKFHFDIVPKISVDDGINATRAMLRVARFNKPKVQGLLDCLYSYRREYDEKTKLFRDKPVHDWASHGADAMRYLSVGWDEVGSALERGNEVLRKFKVKRSGDTDRSFSMRSAQHKVIRS